MIKRQPLKKKYYHINKYSKKRAKQIQEYNKLIQERDDNGEKHICFACNREIVGIISHHHLSGRLENLLLKEELLVDTCFKCHFLLHNSSVHELKKYDWYVGFLNRLRALDETLYNKQLNKENK
jgi:hypothetical protein